MRVDSSDDRRDRPDECDSCMEETAELERFYSYGPGHHVAWQCGFCSSFLDVGTPATRNLAQLGHILMREIRALRGKP